MPRGTTVSEQIVSDGPRLLSGPLAPCVVRRRRCGIEPGTYLMTVRETAPAFPRFGDVAHVGHVELLTPKPEASLEFFTRVIGLHESGRSGDSVYLRAWGDYEWHTLKLTASSTSGIGHLGLRVRDEDSLARFVTRLEDNGASGTWVEDEGHGPAFRCATPDGHAIELYFQTRRFAATPELATAFKN